MQEQAY